MKKMITSTMVFLIAVSMFSFLTPMTRAGTGFSRPSLPDGPAHSNELVTLISANTTKVLIVTGGYGPLTGVSTLQEKDFWTSVLSAMPDLSVDWFDGVPTFQQLSAYDLVIYDAGGYWYPLSGGVTAPLQQYHSSGKPLVVVSPDINYDWYVHGEPVPTFVMNVLHIRGDLGIMPQSVYDIYADTGHEIVFSIPKDVGIGVPALTSWPDCFDPSPDCERVLRQGYIPETEFGVGTCSGLPKYSLYDPAGSLFAVVAYPGSNTEGRAVTFGFPISGLENQNTAKQLATSTIQWALQEKLLNIELTLYIEDAIKGKDEQAAPVVNKAPGDKIDVVAALMNKEKDTQSVDIVFQLPSTLSLDKCFTRNDFSDTNEKVATTTVSGNKITVNLNLDSGKAMQTVLRFTISSDAPTSVCPIVTVESRVGKEICATAMVTYNMVANTKAIFVTNRHLLYDKYDKVEVDSLLRYLFKIADWHEQNCIIYYADHVDETLAKWDQNIDFKSEQTANIDANLVDNLIQQSASKLAEKTYWGPILISVKYPYVVIVGSDEIIPFYRVTISGYSEETYNSQDPVLNTYDHGYFLTDMRYAALNDHDWQRGSIDLSTSRIVGASAADMKSLVENGLLSPTNSNNAVVGTAWSDPTLAAGLAKLRDNKGLDILNDGKPTTETPITFTSADWGASDLVNLLKKGCLVFEHSVHGDYWELYCSGHTNLGDLKGGSLDSSTTFSDADVAKAISADRTFFTTDSCHTGVVTDQDGNVWNPTPQDNLAWAIIHDGASGYLALTSYGWAGYSDKLDGLFYESLLDKTTSTSKQTDTVGNSLVYAVKHYSPKDWLGTWDNLDRVTVTEPILYGIPWMSIDPPSSTNPPLGKQDFVVNLSKPQTVGTNAYEVTIDINLLNYSLLKTGESYKINIEGSQEITADGYPIIPETQIPFKLPLSAYNISLSLAACDSNTIGFFSVPLFNAIQKNTLGSGSSANLISGPFPSPLYGSTVSESDNCKEVTVSSALAQWNPVTNETRICNHIVLKLTYYSSLPLVVTNFDTKKSQYVTGETINSTAEISNIGSNELSGLEWSIVLKDCFGQIQASSHGLSPIIESGETMTASMALTQNLPHGTYEFFLNFSGNGVEGCSSKYIEIMSGGIKNFKVASKVHSGNDAIFEISYSNSKPTDISGECVVYLYDSNDIEIAELHSLQTTFPSNAVTEVQITWSTAGKEMGAYLASTMVYAGGESFGPAYNPFEIISSDNIPPDTTLKIGEPKYFDITNNIYVTSGTQFSLLAEDNQGGSGVASTTYHVYNGTYDSEWLNYTKPFNLTSLCDGNYTIGYNSTDNAGNVELTKTNVTILDNTPPTTTHAIGNPKYVSGRSYVTPDTPFTLTATDTGSGVKSTAYRITNSSSYDSGWQIYPQAFNLISLSDGNYTIAFNSTDNVGNVENMNSMNVTLVGPDVNGDGKVDMTDITVALSAFGSYPSHPRWNPMADVNVDGRVDIVDIVAILMTFGKHYP